MLKYFIETLRKKLQDKKPGGNLVLFGEKSSILKYFFKTWPCV